NCPSFRFEFRSSARRRLHAANAVLEHRSSGGSRVTSRVPRYHQLAQSLRGRMAGGALVPGARLDNQRRLAQEDGVTLMTLRQALEVLERDGLIARRHGLGTFVAGGSVDYDILSLRTFAGDLSARGGDVTTRYLRAQFEPADREVARALGVRPRQRVFALERLRLVAGGAHRFPGLSLLVALR